MESESTNELDQLERLMKRHDWFYHYSDDQRKWRAGSDNWNAMKKLMDQINDAGGKEDIIRLWKRYAPKAMADHYPKYD